MGKQQNFGLWCVVKKGDLEWAADPSMTFPLLATTVNDTKAGAEIELLQGRRNRPGLLYCVTYVYSRWHRAAWLHSCWASHSRRSVPRCCGGSGTTLCLWLTVTAGQPWLEDATRSSSPTTPTNHSATSPRSSPTSCSTPSSPASPPAQGWVHQHHFLDSYIKPFYIKMLKFLRKQHHTSLYTALSFHCRLVFVFSP